jgi:hypothetical protein
MADTRVSNMNLPLLRLVAFLSGITVTFGMIVPICDLQEGLKTREICRRTAVRRSSK